MPWPLRCSWLVSPDIGLGPADMGAPVEHIQAAMDREGVPFHTQNRFLAKLAPMRREVLTR